jgi:environmental stress-induced protein Ves
MASTSSSTESTIDSTRSTSPPKSACPGVSTMLMRVEDGEEVRMQRRLAAGDLHDVGFAFVGDDCVEHALDGRQIAKAGSMRARLCVADRAAQVTVIGDLDQGQAAMLHVLWTQTAIVRTAPALFGVEALRQLRWLDEHFARLAVIRGVIRDQHALAAVFGTPLFEENALVLD